MTPVDITKVRFGEGVEEEDDDDDEEEGKQASTEEAIARASERPSLPVTALAQPALITIAWMPEPDRASKVSRLIVTGAAWNLFFVKTAAAEQGLSEVMSARSGLCLLEGLTPIWVPETRKP